MNIDFFLDNITPQAVEYINSNVKTDNQKSYDKLKKIFLNNQLELTSFDDTYLHIATFDWSGIERDRNWWWQIHSFPFLNWYIDSYSLQNKEERTNYFSLCMAAIDNWNVKTKKHESPLAWHDHGTAFRTRNIVNWLIFCHTKNIDLEFVTLANKIELAKLITNHIEWLSDSNNYSKYTNHGFDQAMILLTISIMFNIDELKKPRLVSRQRLEEEIKFAFTDEGVHKENSAGYQKFMLGRLKQLRSLKSLGEKIISNLAESYIEKAEEFLKAITLPDGFLPMIGDTKGFEVGILDNSTNEENHKIFDYSKSGYVIVKGNSENIGRYYFLMKNCHNSNYHRHDDDLMLYLWCNGETILGDGGLYSHNESSFVRRLIRSPLAHSVPFSNVLAERDREKLIKLPVLSYDTKSQVIEGSSYASGERITRNVNISQIDQGIIVITDQVTKLPLYINFYFDEKVSLNLLKRDEVIAETSNTICKLGFGSMKSVNMYKGRNEKFVESSLISKEYASHLENIRILLSSQKEINTIKIELTNKI